jgi:meso-butanediol dehydrogenase / (S,S)-butanediol dehydrogenase / diacetyl reductase
VGALEGKVAIITGAGQGVGQGIAYAMADEGARIIVAGRTLAKCDTTVAEIMRRGGEAHAVLCDVTDEADIRACIDATIRQYGAIDILVNNAQEVFITPLLDASREQFQRSWLSGPLAAFSFMQGCHEHLRDGGVVINLATAASLRADPDNYGLYASVKEAMRMLTRTAATEWGPDGIRVMTLIPLATSAGYEQWAEDRPAEAAAFLRTVPLGRVGHCEHDIGRAAVFLASKDASYITGGTLIVDGGQAYLR